MLSAIFTLGFLIGGIYATIPAFWMLVHPFVHRWRAARVRFKWLGAWWGFLWIVAWSIGWHWRLKTLGFGNFIAFVSNKHAYAFPIPILFGPIFWACSLYLYSKGGSGLSLSRVIGTHEVEPRSASDQLITTGIYSRTRNPIYLGHTFTLLGWCCATSTLACWGDLVFYLLTLAFMLPMEERELRQRFGPAYDDYCQRVPRLIPRF